MSGKDRGDAYTRITETIAAAIEAGAGKWRMPWHHSGNATSRPTNISSSSAYRGINVLCLWAEAQARGFAEGTWGTYRQWQAVGGQVRRGETALTGVFWKKFGGEDSDEAGDVGEAETNGPTGSRPKFMCRTFSLFNIAQVDGYETPEGPELTVGERLAHADAFCDAMQVDTRHGPYNAHYRPSEDRIYMPPLEAFDDAASYYGTRIHELAHSTMAPHRLARDLGGIITKEVRAREELLAELTAGFVLGDLGIANEPRPDHAAYLASWLKSLREDPKALFKAASEAQAVADWMHAQQPGQRQEAQPLAA